MWIAEPKLLDAAIAKFIEELPGWWFSVGLCHVSADASCGPDRSGQDANLLKDWIFDDGFDANLLPPATMADALLDVMEQALAAKAAHRQRISRESSK